MIAVEQPSGTDVVKILNSVRTELVICEHAVRPAGRSE
jgi:hypothetical protein